MCQRELDNIANAQAFNSIDFQPCLAHVLDGAAVDVSTIDSTAKRVLDPPQNSKSLI